MKSIEKYSKEDAKSWKGMFEGYLANRDSIISLINSPPSSPIENIASRPVVINDNLSDRKISVTIGEDCRRQTQSMRSWCNEHFESDEVKSMLGTFAAFVGLSPDDAGGGELCYLFSIIIQDGGNNVVKGDLLIFRSHLQPI